MTESTSISTSGRHRVQVVHRAAAILLALRDSREGLSLAEIARRVGLPRSTVHRLVAALEQERLVVAAPSSRGYLLGPTLASFTAATAGRLSYAVRRFLVELCAEVEETVDLAILEHDQVLFVDQVIGTGRQLHAVSAVGATFPAHCTANGKALLAALPERDVRWLLPAKLESYTPRTIPDRNLLLRELAHIRSVGFALDREEHTAGICAVGTSIGGHDGVPRAAVTIVVPSSRFYGSEDALAEALLRKRAIIEESLRPT